MAPAPHAQPQGQSGVCRAWAAHAALTAARATCGRTAHGAFNACAEQCGKAPTGVHDTAWPLWSLHLLSGPCHAAAEPSPASGWPLDRYRHAGNLALPCLVAPWPVLYGPCSASMASVALCLSTWQVCPARSRPTLLTLGEAHGPGASGAGVASGGAAAGAIIGSGPRGGLIGTGWMRFLGLGELGGEVGTAGRLRGSDSPARHRH